MLGQMVLGRRCSGQRGLRAGHRAEHPIGDRLAGETDLGPQQRRLAVGDVGVREADPQHPRPLSRRLGEGVLEVLQHRRAEAAGQDVLLDRHQQLVLAGQTLGQLAVDRLGEAGVGDGRLEPVLAEDLGGFAGDGDPVAVAEQGDPLALGEDLARRRSGSACGFAGSFAPSAAPRG